MEEKPVQNGSRKQYIIDNDINVNYSTIYLLPMLGYKESFFNKKQFISSYILEDTQKKLVLCFNNSSDEEFKGVIWQLQNHKDFLSVDYDDDDKEVVVMFTIPEERSVDFNLFKIGRYTKFSNEYKEMLLEYHGRKSGAGKCIMMVDSLFPDHLAKKYRADKMSAFYIGSVAVSINDLPGGEVMSILTPEREYYVSTANLVKKEEGKVGVE